LIVIPPKTIAAKMHQPQPSFPSFANHTAPAAHIPAATSRNTTSKIVSIALFLSSFSKVGARKTPNQSLNQDGGQSPRSVDGVGAPAG
jgi:hypothetical protein